MEGCKMRNRLYLGPSLGVALVFLSTWTVVYALARHDVAKEYQQQWGAPIGQVALEDFHLVWRRYYSVILEFRPRSRGADEPTAWYWHLRPWRTVSCEEVEEPIVSP